MSAEVNADAFLRGLDLADRAVRAAASKGMGLACERLLRDTILEMPSVPKGPQGGTPRGSGSAIVTGRRVRTAAELGYAPGEHAPATQSPETAGRDEVVGVVGFNTPYAAYQHEGVRADGLTS